MPPCHCSVARTVKSWAVPPVTRSAISPTERMAAESQETRTRPDAFLDITKITAMIAAAPAAAAIHLQTPALARGACDALKGEIRVIVSAAAPCPRTDPMVVISSAGVWYRSSLFLAIIFSMMPHTAGSISGYTVAGDGSSSEICLATTDRGVAPVKGGVPATMW